LTIDLENMKNGSVVSKVAKWIPSEKSSGYNHTGFNKELAKTMGLTNPVATREEQRRMPASKTTTSQPAGASRAAALPAIPNPTMATRCILHAR
jgi:hypothetical protein